jgi:hypothetical protein
MPGDIALGITPGVEIALFIPLAPIPICEATALAEGTLKLNEFGLDPLFIIGGEAEA